MVELACPQTAVDFFPSTNFNHSGPQSLVLSGGSKQIIQFAAVIDKPAGAETAIRAAAQLNDKHCLSKRGGTDST